MKPLRYVFAGVGGQIDFLRGAALSQDGLGKPILAMPSVTKRGESKIVPFIKQGIILIWIRKEQGFIGLF